MFKYKKLHFFKYYKFFGFDLYGDFIYKKKITWGIYNRILNTILNKSFKKQYNVDEDITKHNKYFNTLVQIKTKQNTYFNKKQNKFNINYIFSIYAKRFKLFYNNISTNNIKFISKKNIKQYKYNYASFLILWELRLDTLIHRLHFVDNLRNFKQKFKFSKIFLINGKIVNNMNHLLKIGDILSIRLNKRKFLFKYLLNKQINQFEWFLIKNLYNVLGKKIIFLNKNQKKINYNKFFIEQIKNEKFKNIYHNIYLNNFYYSNLNFFKQKRPYRINNIKPILYNYPIYTEVNWRTLNISIIPNNLTAKLQIPYKTDLFWESVYHFYKR
jgi:ribosomal protein S4